MTLLLTLVLIAAPVADGLNLWTGVWMWDLCHEDRKPDHDLDTYCRQGRDRILIEQDDSGVLDIKLCPANPWGERDIRLEDNGRILVFRSREGYLIRLTLGEDRAHFRGLFRSPDGHSGRIQGRRVSGCS